MDLQLDREKLDILANEVRSAGQYAKQQQSLIHRDYKKDGTVITETDLAISKRILALVGNLFPEANIISEETLTPFDDNAPCTFVLDPIDGTDMYSQGFPSWAVALAILDKERKPVGAYISAPRWGIGKEELFVRLDPYGPLLVNDEIFTARAAKDFPYQITMGSSGQRLMDFSHFQGKVRIYGSSIIHMLCPVLYDHIEGCVNQSCYIWDIAASHAVMLHEGMDIEYINGAKFIYDDEFTIQRKPFPLSLYGGNKACIENLKKVLPPRG
ncbi:inositol monophosphatase/fructose-1,6-bisphosphatase family protein [Sphaerochaeta pleomorpha str. Grapes]|uniref:Inositol monophosphatase/fructose-1,6-bisphosphatase family protein n=1 Tax=Sphaerochaeta pleomorpha (strain ATCC BAA-1885 / DSM 22778 / Grapes) TaxID=158190 RepID=G8QXW6_SPHPG|nr:inositol monophosphatase family protein [Sphaerochaeta pleomorpha]AEV28471.1 inositol monophosphatase/fructose-1,6-bisphosphatase family protein [Sphaerochaeta pleomorpha str. Grapes]